MQPGGIEKFTYAYDYWVPLLSVSLAFALLQNLFFWAQSYWSGELLALGGNSGHFFYDVSANGDGCYSFLPSFLPPSLCLISRDIRLFSCIKIMSYYSRPLCG